jgi:hypothetical protein
VKVNHKFVIGEKTKRGNEQPHLLRGDRKTEHTVANSGNKEMLRCSTQSRLEQNANGIRRKPEFAATEGSNKKERNPVFRVMRDRGIQMRLDTLLHDDAMSKRNPPKIHDEEEEELTRQ